MANHELAGRSRHVGVLTHDVQRGLFEQLEGPAALHGLQGFSRNQADFALSLVAADPAFNGSQTDTKSRALAVIRACLGSALL